MFFFNPHSSSLIYWLQENSSSQVKIIFIIDHHCMPQSHHSALPSTSSLIWKVIFLSGMEVI